MIAWRICKRKWAAMAFTGAGAAENPGRWNSEGRRMVYCAESRALAALEVLVNTESKRTLRKAQFVVIPVEIPDDLVLGLTTLPRHWHQTPPGEATRRVGDAFLDAGEKPVLRVPSVAVEGEYCFLLNPAHSDFGRLAIGQPEAFVFDGRMAQ